MRAFIRHLGFVACLSCSGSAARADAEAVSRVGNLPCEALGYNNLSHDSQGDTPFGIPLRQWDEAAVSAVYARIRACAGQIDPVQARFALQQGPRFLDGLLKRASAARANESRSLDMMEKLQADLAGAEASTSPPAQALSRINGVQAELDAISRVVPSDLREAFQKRIDVKRAAVTAVLQAQAEGEQKAAEDRLAKLRAQASAPAPRPAAPSTSPPPSGVPEEPTTPQPGIRDPNVDPKIAEAQRKKRLADAETARLEQDLRRKQIEDDAAKLDGEELDLFRKNPHMRNPDYVTTDNPLTSLTVLYAADVMFRVCKERTSEFDDLVPKVQHQEQVLEGTLVKLGFVPQDKISEMRSNVGLNGGSNEMVDQARAAPDIIAQCREMQSTLGLGRPLAP